MAARQMAGIIAFAEELSYDLTLRGMQRSTVGPRGVEALGAIMPKLTVEGVGTVEVPSDKRLVLALEDEARVDQLHACGGNARCTTCRVQFIQGEPQKMTAAEKAV